MAVRKLPEFITPEEYLEWEKEAEFKSEYHDGLIVGMAGARPPHNLITSSLLVSVYIQVRKQGCQTFTNDQRVRVENNNRYLYPDLTIVCGTPEYEIREGMEQLTNPTFVFEVLSDSTASYDGNEKRNLYFALDSLIHYVLVSQEKPQVEVYSRLEQGGWWYRVVQGLSGTLLLESPNLTLSLTEIYDQIEFSAE